MRNGTRALLLLDTHMWIWLVSGEKRLQSSKLLPLITQGASTLSLRVSIMSVWEVGMLEAKGRIAFPYSCLEWVRRALQAPGILLAELTPEIAIESSRLPGSFPGDPADRIIVATARSLGATLVTQDTHLLAYARHHDFHAISA